MKRSLLGLMVGLSGLLSGGGVAISQKSAQEPTSAGVSPAARHSGMTHPASQTRPNQRKRRLQARRNRPR